MRSPRPTSPPKQNTEQMSAAEDRDVSKIQQITEAVVYGIRAGQLVPGQHLVEADLTQRFGISRGSLREALKHLAADGIVTLNRYRGAYICSLDRKSIGDLLDTLEPLCSLAARLAATNCQTAAQRQQMKRVAASLSGQGISHSRAAYLENRRHFYDKLLEIGGNAELARVIPLARTDLFRAQFESIQSERQRSRHAGGYGAIADAVVANDVRRAESAVRRHFDNTRKTLEELPATAFTGEFGRVQDTDRMVTQDMPSSTP